MSESDDPVKRAAELVHELSAVPKRQKTEALRDAVDEVKRAVSDLDRRLQQVEAESLGPDQPR